MTQGVAPSTGSGQAWAVMFQAFGLNASSLTAVEPAVEGWPEMPVAGNAGWFHRRARRERGGRRRLGKGNGKRPTEARGTQRFDLAHRPEPVEGKLSKGGKTKAGWGLVTQKLQCLSQLRLGSAYVTYGQLKPGMQKPPRIHVSYVLAMSCQPIRPTACGELVKYVTSSVPPEWVPSCTRVAALFAFPSLK